MIAIIAPNFRTAFYFLNSVFTNFAPFEVEGVSKKTDSYVITRLVFGMQSQTSKAVPCIA